MNYKKLPSDIPASPWTKKVCLLGVFIIVVFIGGFCFWAFLAPLESAAIVSGKVKVAGNRRTIQHLEGGIIKVIYVKDGSLVKKGQVLIKLDDTQNKIMLRLRKSIVLELQAVDSRLMAEQENKEQINFSKRLVEEAVANLKARKLLDSQRSIFLANEASYNNSVHILKQRIRQLNEQEKGVRAQIQSANKQLKLLKMEIKSTAYLAKRKLVEQSRLIALQREDARLSGSRGEFVAKIAELKQKVGETEFQIMSLKKDRYKEIVTKLQEIQQKLSEAIEKETAVEDILQRTDIRSPQNGIVVGLRFFTVGGVIKPGEPILDVVPQHEKLVVEARVSPIDIDVVHKGLIAKVQFTAFKTRSTPDLLGTVTQVSADAFIDSNTGMSYYIVRITIPKLQLKRLAKGQELYPGMPVQAMIITANQTPFEYFIAPILDSFHRAFREQ